MRDILDSGAVYEPKTVQTSFTVSGNSTFAYLFGIDLSTREFLWLDLTRSGSTTVAGATSLAFLLDYFGITGNMNMYKFFGMLASELTDDPQTADIIVSDSLQTEDGDKREVIHSYDFEKLLKLME